MTDRGIPRKVVYLPTCVTRIMGPARGDDQQGAMVFLVEMGTCDVGRGNGVGTGPLGSADGLPRRPGVPAGSPLPK